MTSNKYLVFCITIFSIFFFSQSVFAAKKVIRELNSYRNSNDVESLIIKSKRFTKILKNKVKPPKFRSKNEILFNKLNVNLNSKSAILLNEKIEDINKIQIWDLNANGIKDMTISFANNVPTNIYIDLNENNTSEIEYVFSGLERWIYFDKNEDGKFDFVFIDRDNDTKYEEIIKIEN